MRDDQYVGVLEVRGHVNDTAATRADRRSEVAFKGLARVPYQSEFGPTRVTVTWGNAREPPRATRSTSSRDSCNVPTYTAYGAEFGRSCRACAVFVGSARRRRRSEPA